MIQYASAELPALKEAQPLPPRSKGDQLQLTFLQRVLILLATIMMIVIDHGCVSSSPEGHAGFVSEHAFSTSSCTLSMKCFPDQTTVSNGVTTHIARSTCPASTSLPIYPPIFGEAGDSVSYTNDLTAPFTAADEIEPIQWLQSTTMRDRQYFVVSDNDLNSPHGLYNNLDLSTRYPVINAINPTLQVDVGTADDKDEVCWPTASTDRTTSIYGNFDSPDAREWTSTSQVLLHARQDPTLSTTPSTIISMTGNHAGSIVFDFRGGGGLQTPSPLPQEGWGGSRIQKRLGIVHGALCCSRLLPSRTSHPQYPRQSIHCHLDMTCI